MINFTVFSPLVCGVHTLEHNLALTTPPHTNTFHSLLTEAQTLQSINFAKSPAIKPRWRRTEQLATVVVTFFCTNKTKNHEKNGWTHGHSTNMVKLQPNALFLFLWWSSAFPLDHRMLGQIEQKYWTCWIFAILNRKECSKIKSYQTSHYILSTGKAIFRTIKQWGHS